MRVWLVIKNRGAVPVLLPWPVLPGLAGIKGRPARWRDDRVPRRDGAA